MKIASYPRLERKLVLVPMDKSLTHIKITAESLNEIYKPYYIEWQIRIDSAFTDKSWDTGSAGLQATGSGFFSEFTDEMKALNSAYSGQRGVDGESLYLFVFPNGNAEGNLLGDMPLESRFGYIFDAKSANQDKLAQTTAHELGHGAFQLKHTFSDKYKIPKSTTDNLMDYNSGRELVKYQWDAIHDPQNRLFGWMQGEEEGQMAVGVYKYFCLQRVGFESHLSNKGKRKKCGNEILNNDDDCALNFDYKFYFRDTSCNNLGLLKYFKVKIKANNVVIGDNIGTDTLNIKKYLGNHPKLYKGTNPCSIILSKVTGKTWNVIDTLEVKFVILKPQYRLCIEEKNKKKVMPFEDPTQYTLTTDSSTSLSIYDKQSNTDSILIKNIRWIINRNVKQLKDTVCNLIKVSSNGIGNINVTAIYPYKNQTDTSKLILTAPENLPITTTPIVFKLMPNSASDRMVYTNNAGKGYVAIKNDAAHTVELKFERINHADDFTLVMPVVVDSVRLSLTILNQTTSSITVRIQPKYAGALLIDSTYIKLIDNNKNCRATQVVYILKPFVLELNAYNAPGMVANYDIQANQILEYIYGSVVTKGTQPMIANPDKNGNHFIDRIYGNPIKDEYPFLENHPKHLRYTNVYFIDGVIKESWKIDSLTDRKNVVLFDMKNLPSQVFQCEILDTAFIVLESNLSATKTAFGVSFPANVANNTRNKAAYLRKMSGSAGLKFTDNAVIVGTTDTDQTLVHELLHILKLFDINVPGNMMHYTTPPPSNTPYFSNELVPECETGTGLPKSGGGKQRQWLNVKRN